MCLSLYQRNKIIIGKFWEFPTGLHKIKPKLFIGPLSLFISFSYYPTKNKVQSCHFYYKKNLTRLSSYREMDNKSFLNLL